MEAKQNLNNTLMKFFLIQTKDIKNAKDTMKFLKSKLNQKFGSSK